MNRDVWYKKMYNTIHKAKDDGNLLDAPRESLHRVSLLLTATN